MPEAPCAPDTSCEDEEDDMTLEAALTEILFPGCGKDGDEGVIGGNSVSCAASSSKDGAPPAAKGKGASRGRGRGQGKLVHAGEDVDCAVKSAKRLTKAETATEEELAKEQKKKDAEEKSLNGRSEKLIGERFRDFGPIEKVKHLKNAKGDELWPAILKLRAQFSRIKDESIKVLRKSYAIPGTIEYDLKVLNAEDFN